MKTTIDIPDALLKQARRLAARRHTTVKAIVEEALREALAREESTARRTPVRTLTFGGNGLQSGLSWDDWSAIRDLAYEGRGS